MQTPARGHLFGHRQRAEVLSGQPSLAPRRGEQIEDYPMKNDTHEMCASGRDLASIPAPVMIGAILMSALLSGCLATRAEATTTYFVSTEGSDDNDGLSAHTPWQTLERVNTHSLEPGDVIRFRRGDAWRGQLRPRSGVEGRYVTYSAYGEGPKPLLLGSVTRNRPEDWQRTGDNIWSTREPEVVGPELLVNPDFAAGAASWTLYAEGQAKATVARDDREYTSEPAGLRIDCSSSGGGPSHIQLFTAGIPIEAGGLYRLSFRARSTSPLSVGSPRLMSAQPPWQAYSAELPFSHAVGRQWGEYAQFYLARETTDDARLTFYLGGCLPEGASLFIDDVSFRRAEGELLPVDVGNIIFDDEASCGVKVFDDSELDAPGKYWYDEARHTLKLYSAENPGLAHSSVECALRRHIISQSNASYVVYENLALKYGAAHGIGGGNTHHIIVRDCDLSYIGGGDQYGGDRTVRFGNGVEFWGAAHDNIVERCRLWEIYDAALTNQSLGPATVQANITYRNNIVWNCEYSFEYWNRPEASRTENISFEHNTCMGAGHGWGHTQRPDPSGRHLCFYTSTAPAQDIIVRNNIFCLAKSQAFFAPGWSDEAVQALVMDGNCWYQPGGTMVNLMDTPFTMAQFAQYQTQRDKEAHSITARPMLVDFEGGDFGLAPGSPCIDAGVATRVKEDFEGRTRPQGAAPDIGAYEMPGRG